MTIRRQRRSREHIPTAITPEERAMLHLCLAAGKIMAEPEPERKHATAASSGRREHRMDMTWVTERIAVGGGIWNDEKMIEVVRAGITHIIDMQLEFDDTRLAEPYGISVLWNPTDDDFRPKPPALFQRGVDFALEALDDADTRIFIHCAAGVHRAPMMTLAVLRALGVGLEDALDMIQKRRAAVDFAAVYVESVEEFMRTYEGAAQRPGRIY
jgi:protein-tyrosine phosphatase